jgi:hypothetical protein
LGRIQAALFTVEEALRKHDDLMPIHAVLELCEESVGRESDGARELAKLIAPHLFQPEELSSGQALN